MQDVVWNESVQERNVQAVGHIPIRRIQRISAPFEKKKLRET